MFQKAEIDLNVAAREMSSISMVLGAANVRITELSARLDAAQRRVVELEAAADWHRSAGSASTSSPTESSVVSQLQLRLDAMQKDLERKQEELEMVEERVRRATSNFARFDESSVFTVRSWHEVFQIVVSLCCYASCTVSLPVRACCLMHQAVLLSWHDVICVCVTRHARHRCCSEGIGRGRWSRWCVRLN